MKNHINIVKTRIYNLSTNYKERLHKNTYFSPFPKHSLFLSPTFFLLSSHVLTICHFFPHPAATRCFTPKMYKDLQHYRTTSHPKLKRKKEKEKASFFNLVLVGVGNGGVHFLLVKCEC